MFNNFSMTFADQYHYRVSWSEEDQAFVGRVDEFPSLSAHGETLAQALEEIVAVVQMAIEDLKESGEEVLRPDLRKGEFVPAASG